VDVDNQRRSDGRPDLGADEYVSSSRAALTYTGLASSSTTISLAWNLDSDPGEEVHSYRVIYNQGTELEVSQAQSVDVGSSTQYTLRDLTPNAVYQIEVQALSADGSIVAAGDPISLMATEHKLFLPTVRQ
jgi:hypothetical protein